MLGTQASGGPGLEGCASNLRPFRLPPARRSAVRNDLLFGAVVFTVKFSFVLPRDPSKHVDASVKAVS